MSLYEEYNRFVISLAEREGEFEARQSLYLSDGSWDLIQKDVESGVLNHDQYFNTILAILFSCQQNSVLKIRCDKTKSYFAVALEHIKKLEREIEQLKELAK